MGEEKKAAAEKKNGARRSGVKKARSHHFSRCHECVSDMFPTFYLHLNRIHGVGPIAFDCCSVNRSFLEFSEALRTVSGRTLAGSICSTSMCALLESMSTEDQQPWIS